MNIDKEVIVKSGLNSHLCDLLIRSDFKPKALKFYNSKGQKKDGSWDNFMDKVECMTKLIKTHTGGNYGKSDEYLIVKHDGIFKMQYYGDSSATIKKVEDPSKENILKYCIDNDASLGTVICANCGEEYNYREVVTDKIDDIVTEKDRICNNCDELIDCWAYGYWENKTR